MIPPPPSLTRTAPLFTDTTLFRPDCGPTGTACFAPGRVPQSRIEGRPDAFVLRANIAAEWRTVRDVTLSAALREQWASDPLLSYEEFSGGNFTVGRDRKSTRLNSSH